MSLQKKSLRHPLGPKAPILPLALTVAILLGTSGCKTLRTAFALPEEKGPGGPIVSPFAAGTTSTEGAEPIILRTKKGDRAVEVQLPTGHGELSDFALPLSPAFAVEGGKRPSKESLNYSQMDETYMERGPSLSDREIARALPEASGELALDRSDVEKNLGLNLTEDLGSRSSQSYLAQVDHVKQLYRMARFEAALLEIDELLRIFPTDSKLHEMRGTLLDRTGRPDLALRAWNEALKLEPTNAGLKRFVERKTKLRALASPQP